MASTPLWKMLILIILFLRKFQSYRLRYVVEHIPTCITYTPSQGYNLKRWKAKHALFDASYCNHPFRDNNDKYYGIQHRLKKDIYGPRMMQNFNQPKHGLMWAYSHLMMEQLHMDIW